MLNELMMSAKRHNAKEAKGYSRRTVYAICGQRLSPFCFAAVVKLSPSTVNRHTISISKASSGTAYTTMRGKNRTDLYFAQTNVALTFLRNFAEENEEPCPTWRDASQNTPRIWLPGDMTKLSVYTEYCKRHAEIFTVAVYPSRFDLCEYENQHYPLSYKHSVTYGSEIWRLWKFFPPALTFANVHFTTKRLESMHRRAYNFRRQGDAQRTPPRRLCRVPELS